jgi:hypothetical protein
MSQTMCTKKLLCLERSGEHGQEFEGGLNPHSKGKAKNERRPKLNEAKRSLLYRVLSLTILRREESFKDFLRKKGVC